MKRLGLVLLALAGCGGGMSPASTGTTPPATPTVHTVMNDGLLSVAAGAYAVSPSFALPAATVDYTITERTSSSVPDTWTVGVASEAEVGYLQAGAQWQAFALETNAVGTVSDSASVPADTYSLVLVCGNLLEDCVFSDVVTATY